MVSKFDRIFMLSPNSLAYRCRMGVGKIMVPRPFALYSITTACHWMAWPAHTRTKNKDKAQFVCIIVYHWVRERFFFCFFLFFSWYRMSDYKRHVLCMNEVYVYGNLIQKRKKKKCGWNCWSSLRIILLELVVCDILQCQHSSNWMLFGHHFVKLFSVGFHHFATTTIIPFPFL